MAVYRDGGGNKIDGIEAEALIVADADELAAAGNTPQTA